MFARVGFAIKKIGAAASGGSAVWGAITGTLSDQTDLQSALNAKANTFTEYRFTADSNTGIDNPGADTLAFVVGGFTAWTINSSLEFVGPPPANATASGSDATIRAGAGGGTSGDGGAVVIVAGDPVNGSGGNVFVTATDAATTGTGGQIIFTGGNSLGSNKGGPVTCLAGTGGGTGAGGNLVFNAGDGGSTSGAGGDIVFESGNPTDGRGGNIIFTSRGGAGGNRAGGGFTVSTGDGSGSSAGGEVGFASGDGGSTGNGGEVYFSAGSKGASGGTAGNINFYVSGFNGVFRVNGLSRHTAHLGSAPSITAGGGTSPSIVGKDEAFLVTIGTGGVATSVEITFANAFINAPIASVGSDTQVGIFSWVTTTTKITITATAPFTAGSKLHVINRGYE